MRTTSRTIATLLGLLAAVLAYAHPATERYIPIGESPGISRVKSYIGTIRSVQEDASGFTMLFENSAKPVRVTPMTKIYLDEGPGKVNLTGTEADCKVGRLVEAYLHDDGTAYWVKIKMH